MRVAYDYSYLEKEEIDHFKPFTKYKKQNINIKNEIWNKNYQLLKDFKNEFGHLLVHNFYVIDGNKLGVWVKYLRCKYQTGKLKECRVKMLDSIGFVWKVDTKELSKIRPRVDNENELYLELLNQYILVNGNCDVPRRYIVNEIQLGQWVSNKRSDNKLGELNKNVFDKLDAIGFRWDNKNPKTDWIKLMKQYKKEHGSLDVPRRCIFKDKNLGQWLASQKTFFYNDKINADILKELTKIGFVFERKRPEYKRSKK